MQETDHLIWTNDALDYEDWREFLEAEYPELTDQERFCLMYEQNNDQLDDERVNLDIPLSQPILVIGDIGRWNGRVSGYKEIQSGNIRDCLYSDTDTIAQEFRSVVQDYNDFQHQLGNDAACLNQFVLSDCASAMVSGSKTTGTFQENTFILPLMRNAMQEVIDQNTHHSDRAKAVLASLNNPSLSFLEPTYDELNPLPPPKTEYRFSLGDTIRLGAQDYELLSMDDAEVVLYDPEYPLFNKTLTRAAFDEEVKVNPFNEQYLHIVEEAPAESKDSSEKLIAFEESEHEKQLAQSISDPLPLAPKAPRQRIAPNIIHPEIHSEYRTNFKIEEDDIGVGTPMERYHHNIMAIQLLHKLEEEHRLANTSEQSILAEYVGWGGLPQFFESTNPHYGELRAVLSEDEYADARESTLTAFYTPPVVIRSMYKAMENMGFKTGNILEPSCGVGNFMGMLPDSMRTSKLYGVELDSISGRI